MIFVGAEAAPHCGLWVRHAACGGEDFAKRYNDTLGNITYRLVHGADIVATVPPSRLAFATLVV